MVWRLGRWRALGEKGAVIIALARRRQAVAPPRLIDPCVAIFWNRAHKSADRIVLSVAFKRSIPYCSDRSAPIRLSITFANRRPDAVSCGCTAEALRTHPCPSTREKTPAHRPLHEYVLHPTRQPRGPRYCSFVFFSRLRTGRDCMPPSLPPPSLVG